MSASRRLFLLLLLLSTVALLSSAAPVLDVDGKPLRPNTDYYILPVIRGMGGGLTIHPLNNTICPLFVAQESLEVRKGLPVKLYPVNRTAAFVHLSTDANFVFSSATNCRHSMVWNSGRGNVNRVRYIGIDGVAGKPGPSTIGSWFKVEKYGDFHKLVFCPDVCSTCQPACGEVGVVFQGARRFLAVGRGPPFLVFFKKAKIN